MSLKEQLNEDLKTAMREKNVVKRDSIRAINTMIKQIEVDERRVLDDAEVIKLIQRGIKQREEAIAQYSAASRDDLVQKEQEQVDVFMLYLPKQLTNEELELGMKEVISEVGATTIKDMGKVMGVASKKFAGVADGKRINEMVKKLFRNEIVKRFLSHLNEVEIKEVAEKKVDSLEKLIIVLLKRVHPQNVEILASILKQALIPSISVEVDDEIEKLFVEIEKNPNLLFNKAIQIHIEKLILKRFEKDKLVVVQKTSDISKLVLMMEEYFNEAISSNGSGTKNILNIREKIESINIAQDGIEALTKLQDELVNAASMIEKEMSSVTNKLESGKSQILALEEKIKSLEDELTKTKTENMTDHLTGVLTRRAFSDEIKRIESSYNRINTQYAVIFFDLDHFKILNDSYGHECGDVVLSTFGKILNKTVREHDLVGRYGGEEFIAIIHFNLNRELLQFLKRIKTIVTENSFLYQDKKIRITFSAGVAIRNSYPTYENALQKADALLYKAKESGRNKILLENGMEI